MATVKGGTSGGGCVKYITQEEKTKENLIEGINCNPKTAVEEMKFTKEQFNKTTGTEYHHFIQSFKPGETTPEQAHEIGKAFAQHLTGNGYQAVLATHIDRDHIHNHVVLNSVNYEDGKKFRFKFQDMWELKEYSNKLCQEKGLSTVDFHKKPEISLTTAEYRLQQKGQDTWKQDLREAIDFAKSKVNSVEEMQKVLKTEFNIEMKIQNKNFKFKHPDKEEFCKGGRLGADYEKEALTNEFDKRQDRTIEERGGKAEVSSRGEGRTIEEDRKTGRTEQSNERKNDRSIEQIECPTSNSDRELLQLQERHGSTERDLDSTEKSIGNIGTKQYERNTGVNQEQRNIEESDNRREQTEYSPSSISSQSNQQQTHSGTEQLNRENEFGTQEHRENRTGSQENIKLDSIERVENSGDYNRSDSNISINSIALDTHIHSVTSEKGERGTESKTGNSNWRDENEKLKEEIERISKPIIEITETAKAEREQRRELISKKIELYNAKENQTIYIEQRTHPNGKIEVRASKNENPFDLPSNVSLKDYANYKTLNHASIRFMVDENYKAIRQENTYDEDGKKVKEHKAFDEGSNKGFREQFEKIKIQHKEQEKEIEKKQVIDRDRGRSR